MRVLWFTGVEFPAVTEAGLKRAAWQEGLRRVLEEYHPEIEMGIAAFGPTPYESFHAGNTVYYNVHRPEASNRWEQLFRDWTHSKQFGRYESRQCFEIIDRFKPDIIFIWGAENPFGLLADRFHVPVIMSIQMFTFVLVRRLFLDLTWREKAEELFSRKFLTGNGLVHRWWTLKKFLPVERKIYQRCDAFEGRTDWDYQLLQRLKPGAPYYHVDRVLAPEYYQAVWNPDQARRDLVYTTSSNAPWKGAISLVEAMIQLKQRGRREIKLHLAGVNPKSKVGRIITGKIMQHALEDQVILLGRISPEEIVQQMKSAALFVLPTHADDSPNSLAEAMMMGIPCVAADVGGVPSMLKDDRDGLLYPHRDVASLADRIAEMLDDRDRAIRFGQAARETALKRHDPKRLANQTVKMYHSVLEGQL